MSPRRWSLRRRVTVAVVAVASAALVLLSLVTMRTVRSELIDQVDAQLRAERVALSPSGLPGGGADPTQAQPGSDPRSAENPQFDRPAAVIIRIDRDGEILDTDPPTLATRRSRPSISKRLYERDADVDLVVTLDAVDGSTRYRAVSSAPRSNGTRTVLAIDLTDVDQTISSLRTAFLIGAGGLLLAVSLAITLIVRRSLRPLDDMVDEASRVAAGERDRRVPATGPEEVAALGTALNSMLSSIDVADAARDDVIVALRRFVGDASHELRTPIATIQGYAELLRTTDLDAEERADAAERIDRTAARMGRLVEDLLTLARLDEHHDRPRVDIDVVTMMSGVASDAAVVLTEHHIDSTGLGVVGEVGPSVSAEPDQLRRAIENLVSNAGRHCPAGSTIALGVESDGSRVSMTVDDDGPGIEAHEQERVFDRFYRTPDGRTRPGAGLGLAIVRAVATEFGGDATIEASPLGGTRATITLPSHAVDTDET